LYMFIPKIGFLHKKSGLPAAYCSHSSIHANCLFTHSLCYNVNTSLWQTSTLPFYYWNGVSLRSRGSLFRDSPIVSKCNNPFIPQLRSMPTSEYTHWMRGTFVLSCVWVNVFGHIFLEMMFPAWMAMKVLVDHFGLSDKNIKYILDSRYTSSLAFKSFSILSHQPILQLEDLVHAARRNRKSYLCFERLIVGYRLQSSLEFPHNAAHLESRDVARYRDYIKTLHGLPLQVNISTGECIALLLQRNYSRRILERSEKEIVAMVRERTLCTVKIATFDGISILEQVRLAASATIFIHVSGSGSHHFIWLSDGAASLTLAHPHLGLGVIGNGGIGGWWYAT
ncbi:unnamed protein product, partial [Rotaria socialis]